MARTSLFLGLLLSAAAAAGPAQDRVELRVVAVIDGSDRLEISREGWRWTNTAWGLAPQPAVVEGQVWDRNEEAFVPQARWQLVPPDADFERARVRKLRGRDLVGLDRERDQIVVCFADTPNGPDTYEIVVDVPRKKRTARPAPRPLATLRVRARIDGSDTLTLTHQAAAWQHHHWAVARDVSIGGIAWSIDREPVVDAATWRTILPAGARLDTAFVVERRARDSATLQVEGERLHVHFADNHWGEDLYDLTIGFEVEPPPGAPGRPEEASQSTGAARDSSLRGDEATRRAGRPQEVDLDAAAPDRTGSSPTDPEQQPRVRPAPGRTAVAPILHRPPRLVAEAPAAADVGGNAYLGLRVEAVPALAGAHYLVLGSLAGRRSEAPFSPFPRVPVEPDALTVLTLIGSPVFADFHGRLDVHGRATARLAVPAVHALWHALPEAALAFAALVWPGHDLARAAPTNVVELRRAPPDRANSKSSG
jgi:hypothetical protein